MKTLAVALALFLGGCATGPRTSTMTAEECSRYRTFGTTMMFLGNGWAMWAADRECPYEVTK